jgi:hypothetical protein
MLQCSGLASMGFVSDVTACGRGSLVVCVGVCVCVCVCFVMFGCVQGCVM